MKTYIAWFQSEGPILNIKGLCIGDILDHETNLFDTYKGINSLRSILFVIE